MNSYDLNFGAVGTFSPLKIRSAPTFLPSLGQPYFGPKRLFIIPQEDILIAKKETKRRRIMVLGRFMGMGYKRF